ncbi:hypothetical protein ATO6_14735 [Oceanicola sp. 22II-s10i]|uniref:hypothetical protein n=1 Tax=Oceanicola sp. 22II-s10i TaxID=1317116 RepID=UPI000B52272A|nr:hypothetical protein [Oceanicola sp. 22II-s10i]OWU84279.1 hypothetical protein ATO6_14735 [Oceanicola sp. 22II-s10i]
MIRAALLAIGLATPVAAAEAWEGTWACAVDMNDGGVRMSQRSTDTFTATRWVSDAKMHVTSEGTVIDYRALTTSDINVTNGLLTMTPRSARIIDFNRDGVSAPGDPAIAPLTAALSDSAGWEFPIAFPATDRMLIEIDGATQTCQRLSPPA